MKDNMIAILIIVALLVTPPLLTRYSSKYYTNEDGRTATNGIIFHNTIYLDKYEVIGEGQSLFCPNGQLIYTRSINHETIKVCK